MYFKEPKNTDEIFWTEHAKEKMKFYYLSESRLKRILRSPEREERGIAPRTVAVMQSTKSKNPTEIWLMYQIASRKIKNKIKKIKIISAWRYPGKSPIGMPPIPEEVIKILEQENEYEN
ncbi:MAG: hypothetical protein ISS87_00060 [Candidatus Pacebacteria bacterium]|nr:hypothetical protein [Candidatus Paceibacterota bacterium]